jgi:hypothetical protein
MTGGTSRRAAHTASEYAPGVGLHSYITVEKKKFAALKLARSSSAACYVAVDRSYCEDSLSMLMVEGTSSTQANWSTLS